MTAILGVSAFYHDSAAALVVDGEIVAAAQQERFSRRKHDSEFPTEAVAYCLEAAGLEASELDYVGFYEKPLRKFERLLDTYLAYAPRGFASFLKSMPVWLQQKLHVPREIRKGLGGALPSRIVFAEHHESHAASAFFPSPFGEAAILTLDGVGEWTTTSYGRGCGNRIELTHRLRFPHSLGLLYSAFTYYTGFEVDGDEYKVMGLAPYGEPAYVDAILEHLMDLKEDGSFRLDMAYFNYCQGLTMTSERFHRLFGGAPRSPEAPITQREMDLAASVQRVTEEVLLRCARHVQRETGLSKLCLAGGVALNCVGNGRILREGPFDEVWIQPAAGDAGGALGTALFIWHQLLDQPREALHGDSQAGSLLGPRHADEEIAAFLETTGAHYERMTDEAQLCDRVAGLLHDGEVVGWFQGRMEFGPRALGARSILADARGPGMQSRINQKVKFREGFRPFAPAVLRERSEAYFDVGADAESPYMLLVGSVRPERQLALAPGERTQRGFEQLGVPRSEIPAVTHVDGSARVQTVDGERNPRFRRLLEAFAQRSDCPVLVNTSFNLGWDPIVCTPRDAYDTFMSSGIDALSMGSFLLQKQRQPAWLADARLDAGRAFADLWSSPCCGASLEPESGSLACSECGHRFPVEDGIPRLFWPHEGAGDPLDVTDAVRSFYEETPFPNYDEHETLRSLIEKSRSGIYARKLDEAVPWNATVLEVGCGTGQLSNFLGIGCRRVLGTDMCVNSLLLGEEFRRTHELSRVRFAQMNLFRPCLRPGRFDVVICNGVLHHTADPLRGFESLLPLVRPGGYFVLGLYNRFGRLATDARRALFRLTGGRGAWLDPRLRGTSMSPAKRRAWFADQYLHPHESKHSVGEVLGWFERMGLEFVRGIPATTLGRSSLEKEGLFDPSPRGRPVEHLLVQLRQILSGSREGGFFVLIGRRPQPTDTLDDAEVGLDGPGSA